MKTILPIIILCFCIVSTYGQNDETKIEKDKNGIICYIKFSSAQPSEKSEVAVPKTTIDFFKRYLNITNSDEFVKEPGRQRSERYLHEHYNQFYEGVKVEGGGYNFHYKDGRMYLAHGHYVKIIGLSKNPSISGQTAVDLFAEYKHIPKDSIAGYKYELFIKEVTSSASVDAKLVPKLVYRICLLAKYVQNDEVGFVDAHTGKVVATEPRMLDYTATGTFETRYNGSKYSITEFYNGEYNLSDPSRIAYGGPIIHTWNLDGDIYFHNAEEFTDVNNYWSSDEYNYNEDDMGLDIHWALQKIVDYLYEEHNVNSFDDQGFDVNAYFHFGSLYNANDMAGYDPYFYVLYFGDGAVNFRPIASLDAVSHEYGHGITDFQIGWALTGNPLAFHEGLSDIWAVILENRISPSSIWLVGEEITLNYGCTRNIENPDGNNPMLRIADTYLSARYNDNSNPSKVQYIRGGVFSHWFYKLVNGGNGTNGIGNNYTVYGIGMDAAEDLIVYAVMNNYLDNTSTYPQLRTAMIDAADDMFGNNSWESMQVANAWYAVGVGSQPSQVYISGPSVVCSSGTAFTVNNLPSGVTIGWTQGPNLTRSSPQGSNPCTFTSTGSGSTYIRASLVSSSGSITLPQKDVLIKIIHDVELYCEGGEAGSIYQSYPLWVNPYYQSDNIVWGVNPAADITDLGLGFASIYFYSPGYYTIWAYTENECGTGNPGYTNFYAFEYLLSPNPASDVVTITINKDKSRNVTVDKNFKVSILDIYGNSIIQNTFSADSFVIPVRNLKDGTYFVEINDGKNIITKKLIIKH